MSMVQGTQKTSPLYLGSMLCMMGAIGWGMGYYQEHKESAPDIAEKARNLDAKTDLIMAIMARQNGNASVRGNVFSVWLEPKGTHGYIRNEFDFSSGRVCESSAPDQPATACDKYNLRQIGLGAAKSITHQACLTAAAQGQADFALHYCVPSI